MRKLQIYSILNGDGETETIVASDIDAKLMNEQWYDYYWSNEYKTTDEFVKRIKHLGYLIDKVAVKDDMAVPIEICPS